MAEQAAGDEEADGKAPLDACFPLGFEGRVSLECICRDGWEVVFLALVFCSSFARVSGEVSQNIMATQDFFQMIFNSLPATLCKIVI